MSEKIQEIYKGKFLSVVKDGSWEYVTRPNVPGIVVVVPMTENEEFVFIEQYRIPIKSNSIEFPAGLVDPGESELQAASRELLEETGYKEESMSYAFTGPPSAGLSDEMISFYVAQNCNKIEEAKGDGHEQITTHIIPIKKSYDWLTEKLKDKKSVIDLKVWTGIYSISTLFRK